MENRLVVLKRSILISDFKGTLYSGAGLLGLILGSIVGQLLGVILSGNSSLQTSTLSSWSGIGGFIGMFLTLFLIYRLRQQDIDLINSKSKEKSELVNLFEFLVSQDQSKELVELLRNRLPKWSISDQLIKTTSELLLLQKNIKVATKFRVIDSSAEVFSQEASSGLNVVFHKAERLIAVASYEIISPTLVEKMAVEEARLAKLEDSIKGARAWLAELTLDNRLNNGFSFNSLDVSEQRLRAMVDASRELEQL
ncbi:MAG: hypothetical protein JWP00_2071 [Chloroflexi bacterium]|jgi:hypothetical protein|nr:hypothetical protein [Chloroflexota bacterium]